MADQKGLSMAQHLATVLESVKAHRKEFLMADHLANAMVRQTETMMARQKGFLMADHLGAAKES